MILSPEAKLLQYIDEHLTSYRELWDQLITQTDEHHLLTGLSVYLQKAGMHTQVLNTQFLFAELKTQATHTLLFYSGGEASTIQQKLMESAALLATLDVYKNVLGFVPVNITCLLDRNETTQKPQALETLLHADAGIWYYTAETGLGNNEVPLLALGTKGYLSVELEVQTANNTIASHHGAIAPNALWRLVWALGSLKDAREDILIEGFYDTLTPVQDTLTDQLHTLPTTTADMLQQWGIQQTLMGLQGFQLHYTHFLLPTCTVNSIISDVQTHTHRTFLPGQAKAQLDFYLVPNQKAQDIFHKLQSHLQKQDFADVHAKVLSAYDPLSIPMNNRFVQNAISSTEKAYEKTPYVFPTTLGSYSTSFLQPQAPIIFIARNEGTTQDNGEDEKAFGRFIKQIVLIIEGMNNATDTIK